MGSVTRREMLGLGAAALAGGAILLGNGGPASAQDAAAGTAGDVQRTVPPGGSYPPGEAAGARRR